MGGPNDAEETASQSSRSSSYGHALRTAANAVERAASPVRSQRPSYRRSLTEPSRNSFTRDPSVQSEHWDGKDDDPDEAPRDTFKALLRDRPASWATGRALSMTHGMVAMVSQADTDKQVKSLWAAQETLQEAVRYQLTKMEEKLSTRLQSMSTRLQVLEADEFGDKLQGRLRALEDKLSSAVEAHLVTRLEVLCNDYLSKHGETDRDQVKLPELDDIKSRLAALEESASDVQRSIRRSVASAYGHPPLFKAMPLDGQSISQLEGDSKATFMRLMSSTDGGDPEEDTFGARDSDFGLSERQTEALIAQLSKRRSSSGASHQNIEEARQRSRTSSILKPLTAEEEAEAAARRSTEVSELEKRIDLRLQKLEERSVEKLEGSLSELRHQVDKSGASPGTSDAVASGAQAQSSAPEVSQKMQELEEALEAIIAQLPQVRKQALDGVTEHVVELVKQETQDLAGEMKSLQSSSTIADDVAFLRADYEAMRKEISQGEEALESRVNALPAFSQLKDQCDRLAEERLQLAAELRKLAEQQLQQRQQQVSNPSPAELEAAPWSPSSGEGLHDSVLPQSPPTTAVAQELGALVQKVESLQLAMAEVSHGSPSSKAKVDGVVRRLEFLETGLQDLSKTDKSELIETEVPGSLLLQALQNDVKQLKGAQEKYDSQLAELLATSKEATISPKAPEVTAVNADEPSAPEELLSTATSLELKQAVQMLTDGHAALAKQCEQVSAEVAPVVAEFQASTIHRKVAAVEAAVLELADDVRRCHSPMLELAEDVRRCQQEVRRCADNDQEQLGKLTDCESRCLAVEAECKALSYSQSANLEAVQGRLARAWTELEQLREELSSALSRSLAKSPPSDQDAAVSSLQLEGLESRLQALESQDTARPLQLLAAAQDDRFGRVELLLDSRTENFEQRIQKLEEVKSWLMGTAKQVAEVAQSPEWTDGLSDSRDQERCPAQQPSQSAVGPSILKASSAPGDTLRREPSLRRESSLQSTPGSRTESPARRVSIASPSSTKLSAENIKESLARMGFLHAARR
mmetsp:Transcript_45052/g.107038  ORF Transcript_45052/g.107038 Transcript_45052/m.107038 type:complete len:1038 (-) Transcript_45052:143-3256(-)